MSIINARSPYIVSVDEIGSSATSIEVCIWNGNPATVPTDPTYTESKLVPSSSSFLTQYNISPLIQGFLKHTIKQNVYSTIVEDTPNTQWCNVQVKRYADEDLLDTVQYYAVNGYGTYNEGYNPLKTDWLMDEGTYYYPYDINIDPTIDTLRQVGHLTIKNENYKIIYTRLSNESTSNFETDNYFQDFACVYPEFIADGNKLEIQNASDEIVATYYFIPQTECYYNPVTIDFVNSYGAWQRTFMFKAKYSSLDFTGTEYNLLQTDLIGYDIREGQRKLFNANATERIKVNSGWVNEDYANVLKQLLVSERILINNSPAIALTKTLDVQDDLNVNLKNYTLEFKYAFDYINTVV